MAKKEIPSSFTDNSAVGFLDKLKASANSLLQAEANAIESLSNSKSFKLDHSFKNLSLFLDHSIAEILIAGTRTVKPYTIITTRNKYILYKFNGNIFKSNISNKKIKSITVWDLLRKHPIAIPENWTIMNFIFIEPKNIEILNKVLSDLLKQ